MSNQSKNSYLFQEFKPFTSTQTTALSMFHLFHSFFYPFNEICYIILHLVDQ